MYHISWTDWAVNATGLIITGGICCGQEAQSVNNTSGGKSGTQSCWWMVDQTCSDPVLITTPGYVVLQTLLLLTCTRNSIQFYLLQLFPIQKLSCRMYHITGRLKACLWSPGTFLCPDTGWYVPLLSVCIPSFSTAVLTLSIQHLCGRPESLVKMGFQFNNWWDSLLSDTLLTCPYHICCISFTWSLFTLNSFRRLSLCQS